MISRLEILIEGVFFCLPCKTSLTSAMASSTITVDGTPVSKDTNIALGKNVQVSSAENATVGGDKIVDNDTSTRWSSKSSDD